MTANPKLTVADVKRCFWVDATGTVRWRQSVEQVRNCDLWRFRGTVAGSLTKLISGVQYRRVMYTKQGMAYSLLAHVIAFVLHNGKFPDGQVDHLDGDGLNNRGGNLRDASRRVNICNAKLDCRNVSGVKGVTPVKQYPGMWEAQAKLNGKKHHLYKGYDFFLAVCARKSFEAHHDHTDRAYSSQTFRKVNPQVLRSAIPT